MKGGSHACLPAFVRDDGWRGRRWAKNKHVLWRGASSFWLFLGANRHNFIKAQRVMWPHRGHGITTLTFLHPKKEKQKNMPTPYRKAGARNRTRGPFALCGGHATKHDVRFFSSFLIIQMLIFHTRKHGTGISWAWYPHLLRSRMSPPPPSPTKQKWPKRADECEVCGGGGKNARQSSKRDATLTPRGDTGDGDGVRVTPRVRSLLARAAACNQPGRVVASL